MLSIRKCNFNLCARTTVLYNTDVSRCLCVCTILESGFDVGLYECWES